MSNVTDRKSASGARRIEHHEVCIIGVGFGGLAMAHSLNQAGIPDYVIFEKGPRVGGTWRENDYPGARCDVPAALYSLSFAPEWRWTCNYPLQPEILAYMERVADRIGATPRIRFNTEILGAELDQTTGLWTLSDKQGPLTTCRTLVSAVGQLNHPALPKVPGQETFKGVAFHSAEWRHDYDITGKRVAVVGTGASSIQIVPAIAPKVKKLVLLQRSPAWVFPKPERPIPVWERLKYRFFPHTLAKIRSDLYEQFEQGFDKYIADTPMNKELVKVGADLIASQIPDPELRAKVTPDYKPGCKRILASNEWYSALARDNVEVVTAGLASIEGNEIVDSDGCRHEVDAIVYATGFRSTQFLIPMKVTGLDGKDLHEAWAGEPEAYLGVSVPDFPNMFMMYGPNTNTHNSIIGQLEAQAKYIAAKARRIAADPALLLKVKPAAMQKFYEELTPEFDKFSWSGGCHNWYRTASGKVVNNWPHRSRVYAELLARPDDANYDAVHAAPRVPEPLAQVVQVANA